MGARQVHRPRDRPQRPDGPACQQPPRPGHARRLYDAAAGGQPSFARFTFLNLDAAHDFYPDWDGAADTCIAILRTEAGRDPHDKDLHDLVGELSTRSDEFRRRWSAHNVRYHGAGTKHFHHHDVGDLQLAYESVDMISEPGLTLTLYAAEPGSPTAHALDLLASWTAVINDATENAH
jgi:MmyB-like transcription regulator ligand binding domain